MADRSKFTTWVYEAIFVDPKPREYPVQPASQEEKIVNPYLKFKDRYIRNINITVYDPFGYSVADTTFQQTNFLQKIGNTSHVKSRKWVIKNKLLFRKNELINALALSESERLIRQSVFVNDARIFISDSTGSDSVDVNVIVQDKWTVTAPVVLTDVSGNILFRNENLLGAGHQFEQYVGFNRKEITDHSGYYNIANIDHTFISSQVYYQTSNEGTTARISFDRPFYSPLAKWASGLSLNRLWKFYRFNDSIEGSQKQTDLNSWGYDVWLGKSFKLNSKKKLFNQSTNIVIGARYYANLFDQRPSFSIDQKKENANSQSFLGNVGFAVQQYYKDKFIYRFGMNEDVPHGLIIQFLYGAVKKEFSPIKYYLGTEIARAKRFKQGYFSSTVSYGMFFNAAMTNDITINYRLNYLSNLLRIGEWYLREFINYKIVYGQNKLPSETVTLTQNELYGFESGSLSGDRKSVLNFETVAYAPYNVVGFKFAPVLLLGFGMLGDRQNQLIKSNLYQAYSLGLMVRNENLLISTLQVSIGMYPFLPDGQNNVFKYNPVTSFTLRVRAFSVSRPEFINY